MNTIKINHNYWEDVPAEDIIGTQAYPGDELFNLLHPGSKVLDLGCGNGEIAEFISNKGYVVTGIDINHDAIQNNQSKPSKVKYLVGDVMQTLPFEDESFDAVVASFVLLNLMPKREKIVAELARMLKPKGLIWLNDAMVSNAYDNRYELSRPFVDNDNDFFVFKKGILPASVQTHQQMLKAIENKEVERITHHFTDEELKELFIDYRKLYSKKEQIYSPNSKTSMNMVIAVYQK